MPHPIIAELFLWSATHTTMSKDSKNAEKFPVIIGYPSHAVAGTLTTGASLTSLAHAVTTSPNNTSIALFVKSHEHVMERVADAVINQVFNLMAMSKTATADIHPDAFTARPNDANHRPVPLNNYIEVVAPHKKADFEWEYFTATTFSQLAKLMICSFLSEQMEESRDESVDRVNKCIMCMRPAAMGEMATWLAYNQLINSSFDIHSLRF